jgi:hypothetical protein
VEGLGSPHNDGWIEMDKSLMHKESGGYKGERQHVQEAMRG